MKRTQRAEKLIALNCGQCSSCCRSIAVDVTDADIKRLVDHTGLPADKLVKLYVQPAHERDDNSEWILFSYGKRAIVLNKKRNGDCIFLTGSNACIAYEARPMTCRIFPVSVLYDDENEIVGLEKSDVITDRTITCKSRRGMGRSFTSFMSVAQQARYEDALYKNKIEQYNSLRLMGTKKDFLAFLGLPTSDSSPQQS